MDNFKNESEEILQRTMSTFMSLDDGDPRILFDVDNLREVVKRIREIISVRLHKDAVIRALLNNGSHVKLGVYRDRPFSVEQINSTM